MPRHRLFLRQPLESGESITVVDDRAHYLRRVLRLEIGSELTVFNGGERDYSATISAFAKDSIELLIGDGSHNDSESPLFVRLILGISRSDRMDFAVQKATELGVQQITPVFTSFSVVKLDPRRAVRRHQHWQKIAASACEQCGRSRLPTVDAPDPLTDVLQSGPGLERRLILVPDGASSLRGQPIVNGGCDLLVGPEGGFSPIEVDDAEAAGFLPTSLGPRTLRTETAAITAIAAIQALWGDLGGEQEPLG